MIFHKKILLSLLEINVTTFNCIDTEPRVKENTTTRGPTLEVIMT